jgi:ribosomal subunit interface protein
MQIQVNTDHNIEGGEELHNYIKTTLTDHLDRFKNAITRVEVHLSDVNAGKIADNDKRCLLEARVANRQPIVVSHHADTIHVAFDSAIDKLLRSLDSMVGKLTDRTSAVDLLVEPTAVDEDEE